MGNNGGSSGIGELARELYDNKKDEDLYDLYDEFRGDLEITRDIIKNVDKAYAFDKQILDTYAQEMARIDAEYKQNQNRIGAKDYYNDMRDRLAEQYKRSIITYNTALNAALGEHGANAMYEFYLKNGEYRQVSLRFRPYSEDLKGISRRSISYISVNKGNTMRDSMGLNTSLEKHRTRYNEEKYYNTTRSLFKVKEYD